MGMGCACMYCVECVVCCDVMCGDRCGVTYVYR